jgi:Flp pilus assembly protein TadG
MAVTRLTDRVRARLHAFQGAEGGNVLLTFALMLVPIMGFVGAAVDYSRANSDKAAMQAALDAAALMMSKNVSTLTTAQIGQEATKYFNALFTRTDVSNIMITPTYSTSSGYQIVLSATGTVSTTFMRVMGLPSMNINASSTVKWGNSRLRVALVLDNTGSMSQYGKLTALKSATNNLLSQLQGAAMQNGDVYVSIIPFVKDVNVDPVNYQATWIDWTDWDNAQGNGTCSNSTYKTGYACRAANKTWTPKNHNTWNGCVTDRGKPGTSTAPSPGPSTLNTDTNVTQPTASNADTLFPAEQYQYCPAAGVMALSYNWSGMTSLVNSMVANGNTNQAIGLQLGWQSLVGGGPFPAPPVMDPNYQYQQVIILLTDGLNTQDRWYSTASQIDARQQLTCNNINAAGITLYTVQVNTDGDPTSTLLQNCAGSPGKYPDSNKFFLLTSANQIITTFQQIGTALSNLRVAQ